MSLLKPLLPTLQANFRLDWRGIHGLPHWVRVRRNGLRLALGTGARTKVIEYFAILHDACRMDDGTDAEHGPRAARWIVSMRSRIHLDPRDFETLLEAIANHTSGGRTEDSTVATCWDADRLDLARVGVHPSSRYLLTEAARNPAMIAWATARAVRWRETHLARRSREMANVALARMRQPPAPVRPGCNVFEMFGRPGSPESSRKLHVYEVAFDGDVEPLREEVRRRGGGMYSFQDRGRLIHVVSLAEGLELDAKAMLREGALRCRIAWVSEIGQPMP